MALLALAESETHYVFSVTESDINGNRFYDKGDNPENPQNFYYGVTSIPDGSYSPSPNDKVYINTAAFLPKAKQVMNTGHEAYGHAYFYELSKRDSKYNPEHTRGFVGAEQETNPVTGEIELVLVYGMTNLLLEEQIKKVECQSIWNYENYWK